MNTKTKIMINMNEEKIIIYDGKCRVGDCNFLIDETQVFITDITVINEKKMQGYGTLLLNTIKGIAQFYKKPIYLISHPDKIEFYQKMDFFPMTKLLINPYHHNTLVKIMNFNPDNPLSSQVAEVDMLWIPSNIEEAEIYL